MILYHGSTSIVEKPQIIKSDIGRDFGFGFYTTNIKEQAVRWATRKAKIQGMGNKQVVPILNIYEISGFLCLGSSEGNALNILRIKRFDEPSLEWLEFVVSCRGNINFSHEFDLVIGNIANDNVGETVSYVMSGVMRKEDAVERLKFEKINNQFCFSTEKSFGYLQFTECLQL